MNKKTCIFRNKDGRRKIYAYTFLSTILIITGIGLTSIWAPDLLDMTANKVIGSSIILAALSALLYTLSFKDDDKTGTALVYIVAGACALISSFLLIEIWFDVFDRLVLSKLTNTLLIIAIVASIIAAVKHDFFENKKLKDENYLD